MSDGVHLLIPFAGCDAPTCREAAKTIKLPILEKLLARLRPAARDDGDAALLSPPHERVLAHSCGLDAPDGCIPWAAWQVGQNTSRDPGTHAWAWITPCHWHVARDHIVMGVPQDLQIESAQSQALLAAMQPFFAQDGIELEYQSRGMWLARGDIFRGLPSASLDRVAGRDIDGWIPRTEAARTLRRLQQEMQMLLYTHEVNEARATRGLLPVNSFWISGTGALPPSGSHEPPAGLQINHGLRDAALREDGSAWAAGMRQIDTAELPRLVEAMEQGKTVTITLCGPRNAHSWSNQGGGAFLRQVAGWFGNKPLAPVLEAL